MSRTARLAETDRNCRDCETACPVSAQVSPRRIASAKSRHALLPATCLTSFARRQVCLDALDSRRPGHAGRLERVRAAQALLVALLDIARPRRHVGGAVWGVLASEAAIAQARSLLAAAPCVLWSAHRARPTRGARS